MEFNEWTAKFLAQAHGWMVAHRIAANTNFLSDVTGPKNLESKINIYSLISFLETNFLSKAD